MLRGKKIGYLIKQISEQADKSLNQNMKKMNVTSSQIRVLIFIVSAKTTISQKDIEVYLQVSHPTVVGLLNGLEEKGLIRCAFDSADKRVKNVYLTEAAADILKKGKAEAQKFEIQATAGFSEEEIATLIALLEKLQSNIINQ